MAEKYNWISINISSALNDKIEIANETYGMTKKALAEKALKNFLEKNIPIKKEKKTINFKTYLSSDVNEKLIEYCKENDCTKQEVFDIAIEDLMCELFSN